MKVTKEFLEKKIKYYTHPVYGEVYHKASSGNIKQISDSVFKFTQYNFLGDETKGELCGHYTFFVNYKTFDYFFYKSSDYGSLTYTIESDNIDWVKNLNKNTKSKVESIIASKLLGAYYHGNISLFGYGRSSLICDRRNYIWVDLKPNLRSDKEIEAIKILEPEYKLLSVKNYSIKSISDRKLVDVKMFNSIIKLSNYNINVDVEYNNGIKDTIIIERFVHKDLNLFNSFKIHIGNKVIESTYRGKTMNIVKMIPDLIKSL